MFRVYLHERNVYVFNCDQEKFIVVFLAFFTEIVRLFVSGSVRQGHEIVGQESRGRQCSFMASNSICMSKTSIHGKRVLVSYSQSTNNSVILLQYR